MRPLVVALMFLFPLLQAAPVSAQGSAPAGKKLWDSADARCRDCHGANAEGAYGPDLAGRQLSFDQFKRAVRKPWGVMPAFPETQHSDQELADMFAYAQSLPRVAEPGPWRTPVPPNPAKGQELMIATLGCAQCHGAVLAGPRSHLGAVAGDFEWFKSMTYEHTTVMPEHSKRLGDPPGRVRMGNFSRTRVPEPLLAEVFRYLKDDLKFRVLLASRLTATTPGTYNLVVQNRGVEGKGLAAEDLTVMLALTPGTKVANATPAGYQGVKNDPQLKAEVAVWRLPKLSPKQDQTYTITLESGGGIARGVVRWAKPVQGTGEPDQVNVAMPPPARAN